MLCYLDSLRTCRGDEGKHATFAHRQAKLSESYNFGFKVQLYNEFCNLRDSRVGRKVVAVVQAKGTSMACIEHWKRFPCKKASTIKEAYVARSAGCCGFLNESGKCDACEGARLKRFFTDKERETKKNEASGNIIREYRHCMVKTPRKKKPVAAV